METSLIYILYLVLETNEHLKVTFITSGLTTWSGSSRNWVWECSKPLIQYFHWVLPGAISSRITHHKLQKRKNQLRSSSRIDNIEMEITLARWVLSMRGGWNWLRIECSGEIWYSRVELWGSTSRKLFGSTAWTTQKSQIYGSFNHFAMDSFI